MHRGIRLDVSILVHLNVVNVVTPSTEPVYMGALILTLPPLTAMVRIYINKKGFFPRNIVTCIVTWIKWNNFFKGFVLHLSICLIQYVVLLYRSQNSKIITVTYVLFLYESVVAFFCFTCVFEQMYWNITLSFLNTNQCSSTW